MTACSRNLPVSSTTAILQPVRMPGSMPSTASGPAGGGEQQVLQVLAKTLMASVVGALLQFQPDFGLDRRIEQAILGVFDGSFELRRPFARRACGSCAFSQAMALARSSSISKSSTSSLGAAADGQHAVRGNLAGRFAVTRSTF